MNFFDKLFSHAAETKFLLFYFPKGFFKEVIMQALNVKPALNQQASKPQLLNEIYEPSLSQKSDKVKVQEANILSLQKPKNINRLLEAYSDCV